MRRKVFALLCTALLCAGMAAAEDAPPKVYGARAHHAHGDCDLPPNSPGGHGMRVTEDGDRVYEASARHPFSVGHYAHFYGSYGYGAWPLWVRVAPDVELGTTLGTQGNCPP